MRKFGLAVALTGLGLFVGLAQPAQAACSKPSFSSSHLKIIKVTSINQSLFHQALALEASYARCKSGRSELAQSDKLAKTAAAHSKWMARALKLSHTSTVGGLRTLSNRMRASGLSHRTAAENIALFDRFQLGTKQFKIKNQSRCQFTTQSGKAIAAHSYASLAKLVINGWMGSSGHKKNLMNRKMKIVGGGLAFDSKAPFCGKFYITQNYAG